MLGPIKAQDDFRNPGIIYLTLADKKTFLQTGPKTLQFLGGQIEITVNDGSFVIEPCIGNGGVSIMTPNIFCPLGTTAFLLEGDADGDGSADTRSFWSISNLVNATYIAPGFDQTDPQAVAQSGIRMSAAPANSGLINAIIPGVETSVTLDFNVLIPQDQREFVVTRYDFDREYNTAQLNLMYSDLPGGQGYYQLNVPRLVPFGSNPLNDVVRITKYNFVEAWPGPTPVAGLGAFHVTNTFVNGALEFDPRFRVTFNWQGISAGGGSSSATVFPQDRLYFSIRDSATDQIIYPLYPANTPDSDRAPIWLQGKLYDGGFSVGPFFQLGVFDPGDNVIAQLEVRRGLLVGGNPSGTIPGYDYSQRTFRWPVRFIDTYEGAVITAFPPGTASFKLEPGYDYDGDGYTNFEEFAFSTDPSRPEDNPSQDLLPRVVDDRIVLTVRKRPFTGSRVDYYAEVSTDGGNTWTRVTESTPNWLISTNSDAILEVRSTVPPFSNPGRIRARVKKLQ